jgi:hypothetical protein
VTELNLDIDTNSPSYRKAKTSAYEMAAAVLHGGVTQNQLAGAVLIEVVNDPQATGELVLALTRLVWEMAAGVTRMLSMSPDDPKLLRIAAMSNTDMMLLFLEDVRAHDPQLGDPS